MAPRGVGQCGGAAGAAVATGSELVVVVLGLLLGVEVGGEGQQALGGVLGGPVVEERLHVRQRPGTLRWRGFGEGHSSAFRWAVAESAMMEPLREHRRNLL